MSGARITDCPQTLILRSHGLPFVLNGGSHIEYSQVTETIFSELRGADRRPIRRTIYHFHTGADLHRSDIDDTGYGIMVSADMMQLTSRSHWRGLRKKVEYADERRETTFNYQVLELNNGNIPMITGTLFTIGDYTGLLDGNQSFSPYKDMGIVQYRVIPYNRRVGSIVVDGERTKSTQSFAYASNVFSDSRTVNLPIRQTTVDSNGEEITRHINYWQNTGRIYSSFTVRNGRVIEAHRNLYDHSLRIVERLTALLDPANLPLADGFDPSTQINDLVESYTYRNNRLVQVRNHHTGISTVFLWSYRGSYPVAEIQNATFEQVQNALGGISAINTLHDTFVPDMDSLNELRTKLPNSKVTTMTYQPLVGIRSITDPRGITTFFTYNGFGQLQEKYIIENGQRKIIHRMEYNWSVQ